MAMCGIANESNPSILRADSRAAPHRGFGQCPFKKIFPGASSSNRTRDLSMRYVDQDWL
jgi:hypothetical protein